MTKRKFAVFDIDGTLIRWQMFHAIFEHLAADGHIKPDAQQKVLAARQAWRARSEEESFMAYEEELVAALFALLPSITIEAYEASVRAAFEDQKDKVYRYTRNLISELKSQGYCLLAISGSMREIVALLADYYGFDDFAATELVRHEGRFTGEVVSMHSHLKPQELSRLIDKHGLLRKGSIGIGDSEGDIAMLGMVEQPVAFNPSKKLFRHAQENGWKVIIERKNMIYQFESEDGHYQLTHTSAEE